MKIFIGYDSRQPLSANVLQHSLVRRASKPISVTMLKIDTLPIKRKGLTDFTFSRYLVPWLCGFQGRALFLDSDMLALGDVAELFDTPRTGTAAVHVVKGKQKFEWPSLMLFENELCQMLTPEYVDLDGSRPHMFEWTSNIGELPPEWNHCVGYDEPRADAKIVHYTQGVPFWFETSQCEYSREWYEEMNDMARICSWKDIMGRSVHAKPVLEKMFQGYMQEMGAK